MAHPVVDTAQFLQYGNRITNICTVSEQVVSQLITAHGHFLEQPCRGTTTKTLLMGQMGNGTTLIMSIITLRSNDRYRSILYRVFLCSPFLVKIYQQEIRSFRAGTTKLEPQAEQL